MIEEEDEEEKKKKKKKKKKKRNTPTPTKNPSSYTSKEHDFFYFLFPLVLGFCIENNFICIYISIYIYQIVLKKISFFIIILL